MPLSADVCVVTDHRQVISVVQDEEPFIVLCEPALDGRNYDVLVLLIFLRQVEDACQCHEVGNQRLPRNNKATSLIDLPSPAEIRAALANPPPGVTVHYIGDINESDYVAGTVLVCDQDQVQ